MHEAPRAIARSGDFPSIGPYPVGREKVREFAHSVATTNAIQRRCRSRSRSGSPRHRHPDIVAPPTFAATARIDLAVSCAGEPCGARPAWWSICPSEDFPHAPCSRGIGHGSQNASAVRLAKGRATAPCVHPGGRGIRISGRGISSRPSLSWR
ncbi:FAS1-like dehydratase domain-containing protein [Rhodococcus wratislaviensis]|uniref:FAS1-like dehydratase domain-containing protein n=1 Tax=Rhodococcus wratislaviensis TaxID=44752 RepID=UPI00364B59CA